MDRAALDVAIQLHLAHGGWCPKGRRAEDGPIPSRYHLQETPSTDYQERTTWNVRDSDGTLILFQDSLQEGTLFTLQTAQQLKKPHFLSDLTLPQSPEEVRTWIRDNHIHTLNVAGPRGPSSIYDLAYKRLLELLG